MKVLLMAVGGIVIAVLLFRGIMSFLTKTNEENANVEQSDN